MLVVIKSPPGSTQADAAIKRAAEITADIVLVGDAAGLALKDMLEGFCGTAFALENDVLSTLAAGAVLEKGVKLITQTELERMLSEDEHCGPF